MTNIEEATIETEDALPCLETAAIALRDEADRDGNVLLRPKLLGMAQKYDEIAKTVRGMLDELKALKS